MGDIISSHSFPSKEEIHLDLCINFTAKIPIRKLDTVPIPRNNGAITQALSPKINFTDRTSCMIFPDRAPRMLTPIREINLEGILCTENITTALVNDPAAEKRNTYDARVPLISPCPVIFNNTSRRI